MPKELVAVEPCRLVLRNYEEAAVPEGHVRVRIDYGSPKRGTELTLYHGARGAQFPMGLGNMCVGKIVELGPGVTGHAVGDRVAGYGHLRETHIWNSANVIRMSDRMSWKEAVCYDPAQFAFAGVRDGQVRLGDRVAVFGLGAIGQMAAQMSRLAGASFVAVVDPLARRRAVALKAGADLALDPGSLPVGAELKQNTDGKGVDVAIETSGAYEALHQATAGLAWGGTIAYLAWSPECKGGLDFGEHAHFITPNLVFSRACSEPNRDYPRWDFSRICRVCWQWLSEGRLQCEDIVQPVEPFAQALEAYEDMDHHPEKSVKLGIKF